MMEIPYDPFNGDAFLHAEVARLIGKWNVEAAVETGTYHGHTTLALSLLCDQTFTIEINEENHLIATDFLETMVERGTIDALLGSSPEVLETLLPELTGKRLLFYLDAHWQAYWPLLDELERIARHQGLKPVIVIHDFQVPDRPELGFDTYGGMALNDAYVNEALACVYPKGCTKHYNRIALGQKRGVLFVEPLE